MKHLFRDYKGPGCLDVTITIAVLHNVRLASQKRKEALFYACCCWVASFGIQVRTIFHRKVFVKVQRLSILRAMVKTLL